MDISPLNFLKLANQWIQLNHWSLFWQKKHVGKYSELAPVSLGKLRGKLTTNHQGYLNFNKSLGLQAGHHHDQSRSTRPTGSQCADGFGEFVSDGTSCRDQPMGPASATAPRFFLLSDVFFSLSWRQWVYYHLPGPKTFHQVWTCQGAGNWSKKKGVASNVSHWNHWSHMRTLVHPTKIWLQTRWSKGEAETVAGKYLNSVSNSC